MAEEIQSRQMSFWAAAAIWAVIVSIVALLGFSVGFGGRRFAVGLSVAALLFAFELFLAAPRIMEIARRFRRGPGTLLAPLVPLFAVLIYSFEITGNWKWMLAGAAYAVLPALLLASSAGKQPGTWEDYAAALLLWLPVEFQWMYRLFPYPAPLTHVLTILMALSTAIVAFLLVRGLEGVGYAVIWKRGFGPTVALHFAVFAIIAVPIGMKISFLTFHPAIPGLRAVPSTIGGFLLSSLGILLFTAWPEEFLFRGVLQNLFSRTLKNEWAGLAAASVIFGLSHILHAPFPNWRYVLLATIAGLFYGHAWMRTRSLVPGVLVHALVDISWHVLFR